jgi:hypothetical protein
MEEIPEAAPVELSPQLVEVAEKEIALYKATLLASTEARSGFHEKLVVITAGSLTIVTTIATNLYIKPSTTGCPCDLRHILFSVTDRFSNSQLC